MYFERLRSRARSLRARLMLWNAGAVLLTATAVLVGVREGVHLALLREMDQVLRADLREIELSLGDPHFTGIAALQTALERKAEGHEYHGWFVQFLGGDGRPTWSSANTPEGTAHLSDLKSLVPSSRSGSRVVLQHLDPPGGGQEAMLVGSSLSSVDEDMARIDR